MSETVQNPSQLKGDFKDLLFLFFPLLMTTFWNYFFAFIEQLFLARLSIEAMEAALNASYAYQIFQGPCIVLAMMAQVSVGRWYGAKDWAAIGPGTWQFIWFSFLSMLITVPCSLIYGNFYFHGIYLKQTALPYFYFFVSMNFLFPLGTALSCFYLGQGKTRLVLSVTLGTQIIRIGLAYLLIFGWSKWIPSVGILGGAVSTLIAQGGFCLLLFGFFLSPKYANIYQTKAWGFHPKLFWECIYPGGLRALGSILNRGSWASIAHLMTVKGGNYLLILSLGGTLFLFLPFLATALCQAQTTVVSQILGARDYPLLEKAFRSGALLVGAICIIVFIPLGLFPSMTFHLLFSEISLDEVTIRKVFFGIWLCFVFITFSYVPFSYILAFKNTLFAFLMGSATWLHSFILYLAIEKLEIPADQFWLVLSLMHAAFTLLYLWRMKLLKSNAESLSISLTGSK